MKHKRKTGAALLAALGLLWMTGGCEAPAEINAAVTAPPPAAETPMEARSETAGAALAAAESYRALFEAAYDPGSIHLGLSGELLAQISAGLAGESCAAVDTARQLPVINGALLSEFVQKAERQEAAELVIYEICPDGGFIRHRLTQNDRGLWVTQTRLAWEGTEPFVGYDESYAVTALFGDESLFRYEYFMPENPAGSNHDGHIDTVVEIPLV